MPKFDIASILPGPLGQRIEISRGRKVLSVFESRGRISKRSSTRSDDGHFLEESWNGTRKIVWR